MNRLNGRIAAGAAGAVLLLATGAAAAVPSAAAARASAVTCPKVDPKTGAVTPKPANGVNWSRCNLAFANLTGASLDFANLSDADLAAAIVADARFENANLTGANLGSVTGNNADFSFADLTDAWLPAAQLLDTKFGYANFTSASGLQADLAHSDFLNATATKADFTDSDLAYANLTNANFTGAALGVDLAHVTVTGAQLAGAHLGGARSGGVLGLPESLPNNFSLTDGYFVGPYVNLAGVDLSGAFAVNDDFQGANLTKANLAGADLGSAEFDAANLTGVSLEGADLSGAELTANAALKDVTWSATTTCPNGQPASAKRGCFAKPAVAHPPKLTVTVRRGPPGTTLTLVGGGFAPYEALTVSFDRSRLATVKASDIGVVGPVRLAVPVPGSAQPGLHRVTATGKDKGQAAGAWFTVATDWDQAGFDSGLTSDNPTETALTPAKAPALAKKFTVNPAGTSGAFAASVDDGAAFVASAKGPLTVVNAATGKPLWTWQEPASWGSARKSPHDQLSQPVVVNGIVYLSVAGQGILAISPGGKIAWQSQLERGDPPYPPAVDLSQPTLAPGVLYATDGDNLYAVDTATGYPLAQTVPALQTLIGPVPQCGQPAVAGGVVYVRCSDGGLYAFTAPGLQWRWMYTVPGTPQAGRLAVSGGTIYLTTSSASAGGLLAISASTHKPEWSVKTAAKVNAPAIAGNMVYAVTQNGLLLALNATTGAHLWSASLHDTTPGTDTFRPSAADGVVYALSNAGAAYAFNAKTGARLWSHASGGTLRTAPVIASGILYIGTRSGGVEAFAAR